MLNLPDDLLAPDYAGGSIANVPPTVAALLGAPFNGLPPLRPDLWEPLGRGIRRVVLILIDACGANLVDAQAADLQPWLDRALVRGTLTSVFPSTTVAALSSLWTGLAPAQHGLVGLNLLLPRFGAVCQMLSLSPTFGRYPDSLVEAGLDVEGFLHGQSAAEQLALAGVPTHAYKGAAIVDSALSRMHGRGTAGQHGVHSFAEMMVLLRQQLESAPGEPLFAHAYWPSIDTLGHRHTPFHPAVAAELRALFRLVGEELWAPLSPAARAGTALLILADHGQRPTPPADWIRYDDHPHLLDLMLFRPAGEARAAYLYARPGRAADILAYLQTKLNDAVTAFPADAALEAGLFGPPPYAPETPGRLGDVVVLPRAGHALVYPADLPFEARFISRHGGLSQAEMLVPWLAYRLEEPPPSLLDSRRLIR